MTTPEKTRPSGFTLDTSGVVPFDGGTLGVISWEGVGQRGGGFAQGYIAALLQSVGQRRFDRLTRATLALIIEDCAEFRRLARVPENDDDEKGGRDLWAARQAGRVSYLQPLTVAVIDDGKVVLS
jgi:hypothetical protein